MKGGPQYTFILYMYNMHNVSALRPAPFLLLQRMGSFYNLHSVHLHINS
jgi:hypothetical protein